MTYRLPLFPLGTVIFPGTGLPLHVFEPRYLALMDDLTGGELGTPLIHPEFGIILIERGHEVGGGDQRRGVGTVVRLVEAERLPDGRWLAVAGGIRRFVVDTFLLDDPYPLAMVDDLDDIGWGDAEASVLADAAAEVRRALRLSVELGEADGPVAFTLDDDPLVASWQLCGLTPVGTLDRQRLLETAAPGHRLRLVRQLAAEASEVLAQRLAGG